VPVLILSILTSSLLFVIFKLFDKYKIDNLSAIIINYLVAFLVGCTVERSLIVDQAIGQNWFYSALFMGALFISLFTLMANITIKEGVSISVLANKMSLIIPVLLAFFFLNEQITALQFGGVLAVLVGIVLTVLKPGQKFNLKQLKWPLVLFLGSGILDFGLKINQQFLLGNTSFYSFISIVFLSAFIIGGCFALFRNRLQLNQKNLIAGIILGVPNFYSIYFVLSALNISNLDSTIVFPINNSGILVVSTVLGFTLFKENLSLKNWIGIICCVGGIFLVALYA
tara:strand:+ start:3145 stop:3996 length:852 start_codon:yes stop_codon:yes gene_type:complete